VPQDDEPGFLESVFPTDGAPDQEPEPEAEKQDPRDAYLPDVVGPRIRNALRGGHGLGGTPRRYGVIVAILVGMTSLPTWLILRTGVDDMVPADRMTGGGAVLVEPARQLPLVLTERRSARRQASGEASAEKVQLPISVRPPAAAPHRHVLENTTRVTPDRPVVHKHKKKAKKKAAHSHPAKHPVVHSHKHRHHAKKHHRGLVVPHWQRGCRGQVHVHVHHPRVPHIKLPNLPRTFR
jgi:hypothetical protein